jgi:hypothetical protein
MLPKNSPYVYFPLMRDETRDASRDGVDGMALRRTRCMCSTERLFAAARSRWLGKCFASFVRDIDAELAFWREQGKRMSIPP